MITPSATRADLGGLLRGADPEADRDGHPGPLPDRADQLREPGGSSARSPVVPTSETT